MTELQQKWINSLRVYAREMRDECCPKYPPTEEQKKEAEKWTNVLAYVILICNDKEIYTGEPI